MRIHLQSQSPNETAFSCISKCVFLGKTPNSSTKIDLCPYTAEVGDKIVVLLGGNVPHILRTEANPQMEGVISRYRFIGKAYCQGYMDGEAIHEIQAGGLMQELYDRV
jgi:hypothetical protein